MQVGNEDWELRQNLNWSEIAKQTEEVEVDVNENELNGPRTEALRHSEMSFYQVKSVKIIKPDGDVKENASSSFFPLSPSSSSSSPQANSPQIKLSVKQREKDKPPGRKVFSQVI